ncbi:hypothetical protein GCM10023174_10680 [Chelativorans composti]
MGNRVNQDGSAARVPSSSRYFITSHSLTPHSHSLTFTPSLTFTSLTPLTLSHSPLTLALTFTSHSRTLTLTLTPSLTLTLALTFTHSLSPVNLSTVSVFFETVLAVSPVCLYAPWFEYLAF